MKEKYMEGEEVSERERRRMQSKEVGSRRERDRER
jgi:hypothetical protein